MDTTPESSSLRRLVVGPLILVALATLAYSNSFGIGFPFDNGPLILTDPRVHGVSLAHIKAMLATTYWFGTFESGLYRPLTTLSYALNYRVLGNAGEPFGYHVFNLTVHIANAILVYLLGLHLFRKFRLAILAAALWVLHPIATEVVTNIAGRADGLSTMGVLGSLLLYIRSTQEPGKRKLRWLGAMMISLLVAVFSKESGIVALGLMVLYDLVYRMPQELAWREKWGRLRGFAEDGYAFAAVPVLIMLAVRREVLRHAGVMEIQYVDNPIVGADFLSGRLTALEVAGRYAWKLLWPRTLSSDHAFNTIPLFQWGSANWREWAALATVAAVLALAAICFRRSRNGFFALAWGRRRVVAGIEPAVRERNHHGGAAALPAMRRVCLLPGAVDGCARRAAWVASSSARLHRRGGGDGLCGAHFPAQSRLG